MKDRKKPEKFWLPHGMPSDDREFAFSSRVFPKASQIKAPCKLWHYQFIDLSQVLFVLIGSFFIAYGYKTVAEMGSFDTSKPFQTSYRLWLGLLLTVVGMTPSVIRAFAHNAHTVSAQAQAPASSVSSMQPVVSGLGGGIIGALGVHLLAAQRDKKKEFRDAARQFREAFVEIERLLLIRHPEHSKLYPGAPQEFQPLFQLLPTYYQQQHTALLRFEPYLPKSKRAQLREIWNEYCHFDKEQRYPTFAEYNCGADHEIEMQKRDVALARIQRMFAYTR